MNWSRTASADAWFLSRAELIETLVEAFQEKNT